MATASMDLDIYSEAEDADGLFADVKEWLGECEADYVLVDPHGAAGGNPMFRFTAPLDTLFALCLKYYSYDYEDATYVFFSSLYDIRE